MFANDVGIAIDPDAVIDDQQRNVKLRVLHSPVQQLWLPLFYALIKVKPGSSVLATNCGGS